MQKQKQAEKKIILVGNPNVGKSVVFNTLTGSYTTVSNSRREALLMGLEEIELARSDSLYAFPW